MSGSPQGCHAVVAIPRLHVGTVLNEKANHVRVAERGSDPDRLGPGVSAVLSRLSEPWRVVRS